MEVGDAMEVEDTAKSQDTIEVEETIEVAPADTSEESDTLNPCLHQRLRKKMSLQIPINLTSL